MNKWWLISALVTQYIHVLNSATVYTVFFKDWCQVFMFFCTLWFQCLGSQDMRQFRPGDPAAKEIIRKLRLDASKQKNKIKATITLKLKELTVFDEKAKVSFCFVYKNKLFVMCFVLTLNV